MLVLVFLLLWGLGGMFLGEVKIRPTDMIRSSFALLATHAADKSSITKPVSTRNAGEAGGLILEYICCGIFTDLKGGDGNQTTIPCMQILYVTVSRIFQRSCSIAR